jgi:hypothetical protein
MIYPVTATHTHTYNIFNLTSKIAIPDVKIEGKLQKQNNCSLKIIQNNFRNNRTPTSR